MLFLLINLHESLKAITYVPWFLLTCCSTHEGNARALSQIPYPLKYSSNMENQTVSGVVKLNFKDQFNSRYKSDEAKLKHVFKRLFSSVPHATSQKNYADDKAGKTTERINIRN